jgi:hypothetical protein
MVHILVSYRFLPPVHAVVSSLGTEPSLPAVAVLSIFWASRMSINPTFGEVYRLVNAKLVFVTV